MIGITVFSETMIRFSTLKHFWVKNLASVTHDDADDLMTLSINKYVTCAHNAQIRQVNI